MSYYDVFSTFVQSFFPAGTLLPSVSALLTALLAIGGVILILSLALTLLGMKSRIMFPFLLIVFITVCALYFWSTTPWYVAN